NGAKADELEWSGADDFFKGKKVTKSEIIQYLTENDPRLNISTRKVDSGLTGESPSYGVVEERNRAILEAMDDTSMVNEEKLNILDNMKSNPDDLVPFESDVAYGSSGDTNSEILEQIKNNADDSDSMDLDTYLERRVFERLKNDYNYDSPSFYQRYNIELPKVFNAGDTHYSSYFPEGAEDYTENLFQYFDPTGRINILQTAESGHFGDDAISTVMHSRTGIFPTRSGGKAMYVGEGQSDPFQQLQQGKDLTDPEPIYEKKRNLPRLKTRNYNESLLVARFNELNEKARIDSNKLRENNRKMFANNLNDEELGRLGREAAIFQINKIIKDPTKQNDSFKDMASAFKIKDELPLDTSLMNEDEMEFLHLQLYNFDEFRGVNLLAGEDKRIVDEFSSRMQTAWTREPLGVEAVQEYMASNQVDWLNEGFRRYYGNLNADNMLLKMDILDARNEMKKMELDNFSDEQGFKKAGAPFMSSQDKWVDQIIGKSILDAVNNPNVDYLTFPDDIGAIAKVTGKNIENLEPGTEKFYKSDTQNRLKKFLKKFDVNPPIGQVFLDPPPIAGQNISEPFSSRGIQITPEFREQVIKKGIPTYALPPVIGYGALNSIDQNENGDQM
ncbi:MAG: hypothetical protein CMJ25_20065, partial [Phycisphaerae bacterium]|nr:hypothetical protein [Phycisphaerae bacterium]